jgi:predicted unusual protein kinase regulating ubiquinone biosynthesis (AarF/ABC1/UbiB family)
MYVSAVRLYHPAPWGWLYSYRAIVVGLRMLELEFIALRYLLFRAPLLVVWTRFPQTRHRRPPLWADLSEVVAPVGERASLTVGGSQLGSNLVLAETSSQLADLRAAFLQGSKPSSRFWSVFGCVLRGLFFELGSAFLKFGQILSMREEVPPTVKRELSIMQDRLPPMSYKQVKKMLERELDRPVEEVFEYVKETPIAVASLAQVHVAKLRNEQEEVALKIQRPYLEGIVKLDSVIICDVMIGIVKTVLPLVRKNTDVSVFTSSYRKSLERERHFMLEGRTQDDWRHRLAHHPIYGQTNYVARTYPEYTTNKLLTMELVKGYYRLDRVLDDLGPEELFEIVNAKIDGYPAELPFHLLWSQACMVMESITMWDMFHGDIHMGNLYLLKPKVKGEKWKVFLCDFGMMQRASKEGQEPFRWILAALGYYRDGGKFAKGFEMAGATKTMTPQQERELRNKCDDFVCEITAQVPGEEMIIPTQWQNRGTPLNFMSMMTYAMCTVGLRLDDWWWLTFKNIDYLSNSINTLVTTLNYGEIIRLPGTTLVKEKVLEALEDKNVDVTNLIPSLPEILEPLREYDQKQVLNCLVNGGECKPLKKSWVHSISDVRDELQR